ncbi:MAG TPA: aldehyde dehydrogenase family protein [Nitrospirales bacterium]|nr:aldehyde dehydrogenase family protein [Nitrospirales bacterium]
MSSLPRPFLINGEWRRTAATAPVRNPYSGATVAEVCQAGKDEIEAAIASAVQAFRQLRRTPSHARASWLAAIGRALTDRQEECAALMTAESGKPITDARREVARAIQTFTIASEEAKRLPGEVLPLDWTSGTESYLGLTRRVPIGPILGITPFNFPLNLVAHKVAPALAAGNPIVIKPAPQTPLTALLLGEIITQAGVPAAIVQIVPCENLLAEQMVADPRFALLSFTGSAAVGWMLKGKCGKKRAVLELGGNAAVIVEPDADLDLAAQRCAFGGYTYSGQTCISVQRVFVHEEVQRPFLDRLLPRVKALKAGDPADERTVIGPLIDEHAAQRVVGWIDEATAAGAQVLTGGTRKGSVVAATVLTGVTPRMNVSCREVFGPVVVVSPYRAFPDAIAAVNDSDFGLQAGVFTRDVRKIFQAFGELEVGGVLANEVPTFRADHMPYGGVKDSGVGREGVRYAIEDMTELKLLVLNLPPA